MAMSLALITGASSGIGKEMAIQLAQQGYDLFLIARRKDTLEEIASHLEETYSVAVSILDIDLTHDDASLQIVKNIDASNMEVDILINNAGFGGLGKFVDQKLSMNLSMIDLNIKAVVSLTHHLLPMLIRNKGKILTVGSIAGFMPGPLQATYFATKAFVNSRSQALSQELAATGVTMTVLCPGATATEFADSANATGVSMFSGPMESAKQVARKGLEGMKQGKRVVITDWKLSFVIHRVLPILPRSLQLKMVEKMQS